MTNEDDETAARAADGHRSSPPADDARSDPETREELLARAAAYAEGVDLDVDLTAVSWEISERAKRRAGVCAYDRSADAVTIRLTWAAYELYGWSEFTDVIRHELVHAWEYQTHGESGHGERFHRKAAEIDAPRHCRSFTDPRLRLYCTNDDCDWTAGRHRASKAVTEPDRRRCGTCGDRYVVEHVDAGRTWRTSEGYERARETIGSDW